MRSYIPLAIAAVALIIVGAAYGFAYYALSTESAKAAALEAEATQKSALLDRAARAHEELGTLASDTTMLNQYLISKDDIVPFLEALQSSGKPLGATVGVISVADDAAGGHGRINLSLAINGAFDAVMRTLGVIEYGPYDGTVQNLSLEIPTAEGTTTSRIWNATLVLSVATRATSTPATHP